MMVAAVSATPNPKTSSQGTQQNPRRPPLLPSEVDNGVGTRRPKSREITSRYMSSSSTSSSSSSSYSSSSRRCPSPMVSRSAVSTPTVTPLPNKRAQSAERRRPIPSRPSTPDLRNSNAGDVPTAAKMLFTSTRSLSVSFQGESFSLPISKTKPVPSPNLSSVRRGTPERRKPTPVRGAKVDGVGVDQMENSKPMIEQHRWPGRLRQGNSLSRSLDCTGEKKNLVGSVNGNVVRALQRSMIDESNKALVAGRLQSDLGNAELDKAVQLVVDANSAAGADITSDPIASDAESVSSGSTSAAQDSGSGALGRVGPRSNVVPARIWQESNGRSRRYTEPGSPLGNNMATKTTAPAKIFPPRKSVSDSPSASPRAVSSSSRAMLSPLRGAVRPASPSKLAAPSVSSPSRRMSSPSRMRNNAASMLSNNGSNTPSILTFAADVRRGRLGETRVVDAHVLRLLYNRQSQWRFVNARADAALMVQRVTAEKSLFNAWLTTSELRHSVSLKRMKLHLLRQNLKLTSILKGQMTYLEEWAHMDRSHSSSLSGATEALKASTLRLPVVAGARADVLTVKDAISSAGDVMQATASSICSLLTKVEEVNALVVELASVAAKERAFLNQCRYLLSTLAALQVKDSSLRTHILQLKRVTSNLTMKV